MACMEHKCFTCNSEFFDNLTMLVCPYCKSQEITNWFDEPKEESSSNYYEEEE